MNSLKSADSSSLAKLCPHCGKPIADGWLLCPNCGMDLPGPASNLPYSSVKFQNTAVSTNNWKRNLIVLGGTAVVIASSLWLPVMTFTQTAPWQNGPEELTLSDRSGIFVAIVILLIMLSRRKWRGVAWIVLSVLGSVWVPVSANTLYNLGKQMLVAGDTTGTAYRGEPTLGLGMFLILAGYTIIVIGSIWDLIQKRKA